MDKLVIEGALPSETLFRICPRSGLFNADGTTAAPKDSMDLSCGVGISSLHYSSTVPFLTASLFLGPSNLRNTNRDQHFF